MAGDSKSLSVLSEAIQDGTFPESNDLLTSQLATTTIPALLQSISTMRDELSHDIRNTSKGQAADVDGWIAQAKKVQGDIARCKSEAREIVEEHQRVEALRGRARDAESKVELLHTEISFTEALEEELRRIATVSQRFIEVESLLTQGKASVAAVALQSSQAELLQITGVRARSVLNENGDLLRRNTSAQLQAALNERFSVVVDKSQCFLHIHKDQDGQISTDALLNGLDQIHALQDVSRNLTEKIESFVLHCLRHNSALKLSSHSLEQAKFHVVLAETTPAVEEVFSLVRDLLTYLHSSLPTALEEPMMGRIVPKLTLSLTTQWLNPFIPSELGDLRLLDHLQQQASEISELIKSFGWTGYTDLEDWAAQAPRIWLAKRKADTLNAVRKAFTASQGTTRQVERTEKQTVTKESPGDENVDDWNANWDDGQKDDANGRDGVEEDTSGWGFDDDEDSAQEKEAQPKHDEEKLGGDETADAWGWDDENPEHPSADPPKDDHGRQPNGTSQKPAEVKELTLTEVYSISDIPDHLVEIIGKDLQDAMTVREENHSSLSAIPAASGLLALPTLALAMFRATAPTYYSNALTLGNMNLYNDSVYMVERLHSMSVPPGMQNVESDCKAMEKFARSAYAKEMDTQRTILNDLLEGAQGFTSCTQFPYSQEIENAVTSTVDRIKQVYEDWKPVLSTSALLQSIGALIAMVIAKVIADVEEMDDISEAQSERLTVFCSQIATVGQLFVSRLPGHVDQEEEPISMVAVYVPNWLKFQYLINILESSLVDIKFLWTEGELGLEFSADEVTDLIKALFADSAHRRSAIGAIRAHQGSRN